LVNKKIIYCLIPARGGSKRIKNKNIVKIKNKPLINYSLSAANKSGLINKIFVATNSKEISKIVSKFKSKKIEIIKRSKRSEKDNSKTEILINEFLRKKSCDVLVLLQTTNIFISSKYLNDAIKKFLKNKFDSMLSVVNFDKFIWKKNKKNILPINYNPNNRPRSQNFKNQFVENGSFYIFKSKSFFNSKNRISGKVGYFNMGKESVFEIDNNDDLKIVKKILD